MKMHRYLLSFTLACISLATQAEAPYPNQPIKIIVGFEAGSSVDVVARVIAQKLGDKVGKPVIVENRPGAGGNIAADYVARSSPDGYTLLASNTGLAIAASIYKKLNFDPSKDLIAVAQLTSMPHVLVSPVNLPANSISELIALAKKEPGKLNLGAAGVGNADHLAGELLKSMANIDMVLVPYKGGAQVMTDVVNGNVSVFFSGLPGALPMLQAKRVKALGVGTAQRSWALPDVPAIAETLPGFDVSLWYGLMAPRGTPGAIVDRLAADTAEVLAQSDTQATLRKIGADAGAAGAEHFQALFDAEVKRWAQVVSEANINLD